MARPETSRRMTGGRNPVEKGMGYPRRRRTLNPRARARKKAGPACPNASELKTEIERSFHVNRHTTWKGTARRGDQKIFITASIPRPAAMGKKNAPRKNEFEDKAFVDVAGPQCSNIKRAAATRLTKKFGLRARRTQIPPKRKKDSVAQQERVSSYRERRQQPNSRLG